MENQEGHKVCNCVQCNRTEKFLRDQVERYTDSLFYDCTLSVGTLNPKIVKGHRMIFASASDSFANMINSDFIKEEKGKDDPIAIEDDISPEAVDYILRFIYGEFTEFPDMFIACEVCKFAHKWDIDDLRNAAEEKLNTAEPGEILPVYETFKHHQKEAEIQNALKIIVENTSEVLGSRHWIKAAPSTIREIIEQPILKVESEKELFEALVRWGRANSETAADLRSIVAEPLKLIRFLAMSSEDFAQYCVEHGDVFSVEEKCQILKSLTLSDRRRMPADFTLNDGNRLKKTFFVYRNSEDETTSATATDVNSDSHPFSIIFSLTGDFPNFVSHVALDCLSLESNHGREADLTCRLTELQYGKIVGSVRFNETISADTVKELMFSRPVPIENGKWYELSVRYFNQDVLCSKKYIYEEPWASTVEWEPVHESLKMRLQNPGRNQFDLSSLHFFYES